MFGFIITVIAIVLTTGLVVATMSYGGEVFHKGAAKSLAATLITQGGNLVAANAGYAERNSGAYAANVATVAATPGLLALVPQVPPVISGGATPTWQVYGSGNQVAVTLGAKSDETCKEVNNAAFGQRIIGGVSAGGGFTVQGGSSYASVTAAIADLTGRVGCARVGTDNAVIVRG